MTPEQLERKIAAGVKKLSRILSDLDWDVVQVGNRVRVAIKRDEEPIVLLSQGAMYVYTTGALPHHLVKILCGILKAQADLLKANAELVEAINKRCF